MNNHIIKWMIQTELLTDFQLFALHEYLLNCSDQEYNYYNKLNSAFFAN
jgi:hypothetical protein